jgi:hypothetical protein
VAAGNPPIRSDSVLRVEDRIKTKRSHQMWLKGSLWKLLHETYQFSMAMNAYLPLLLRMVVISLCAPDDPNPASIFIPLVLEVKRGEITVHSLTTTITPLLFQ